MQENDNLTAAPLFEKEENYRGIRIFGYSVTDSTNTRAKEYQSAIGESRTPTLFISRAQSAGRGTRGRSFESPLDSGVYMSLLFYPDIPCEDSWKITTYAATRVVRAIDKFNKNPDLSPGIKWVNDVYINRKKVAGILTEGKSDEHGMLSYAILGIGINVKRGALPKELSEIAASLEDFGIQVKIEELARALLDEILDALPSLGGDEALGEYRRRSILIGRDVIISSADGEEKIRVTDIADDGSLVGIGDGGEKKSYRSADARLLMK